jgi:hypothetical protein
MAVSKLNRKWIVKVERPNPRPNQEREMFAFDAVANTKEAAEETIRGFLALCIYTAYPDRMGEREDNA